MKVEVTQEDINHGVRFSGGSCPIALALKRVIHEFFSVGPHRITTFSKDIFLPEEAIDFIGNFDNYIKVKPFIFEVDYEN